MTFRLESLSRDHDRDGFDCGSEPLNRYLKETARQHGERGISRTFVLVEEAAAPPKPVFGFFTLSLCQIACDDLPPTMAKRLPREVAGVKLGRLAIATTHQRQGLGEMLVATAMRKCVGIAAEAGGIGLFVDAKDAQAAAYYRRLGFVSLVPDPLLMFLPMKTLEKELGQ